MAITDQAPIQPPSRLPRLFEGDFLGRIHHAEYGVIPPKSDQQQPKPSARIVFEIAEGPRAGTQVTYDANFKPESVKYARRDLMAAGWAGKSMSTFVADIAAKVGTVLPISVRIATWQKPGGQLREWNSVDSIGNVAPPLSAPSDAMTKQVDAWLAEGAGAGEQPRERSPERAQDRTQRAAEPPDPWDAPHAAQGDSGRRY